MSASAVPSVSALGILRADRCAPKNAGRTNSTWLAYGVRVGEIDISSVKLGAREVDGQAPRLPSVRSERRAAGEAVVATVHLEVVGRVQGVGFRWFVREAARQAGLAGWVRNREDGHVEIAASGSESAIAQLVTAAQTGPPGARVEYVAELPPADGEELPHPFTVMR